MNRLLVCTALLAAVSVGACTPESPAPAAPASEAAAPAAATPAPAAAGISLAGKWAGTITCYRIESPFQVTIDAAKPGEAVLSKGDIGVLSWPATVAVNEAARLVSLKSVGPADGAELVEGLLSDDGKLISGAMDRQLCTDFSLTRQP